LVKAAEKQGLGFFREELAQEGMRFKRVVDNMWETWGEAWLVKMF